MTIAPMITFELRSDDPQPLATLVESYVQPGSKVTPFATGVWVKVHSVEEAALVRMAASDQIKHEEHYLTDEAAMGDDSEIDFKHRLDGPADIRVKINGDRTEYWFLWDTNLRADDHAEAIKAGVASDPEAFRAWWAPRYKKLKRQGLVD